MKSKDDPIFYVPRSREAETASCLAHELRNPLPTIRTCLEMLDKSSGDVFEDSDLRALSFIKTETDRLETVIHDILFCSRDCSVEPTQISLNRVLSSVVRALRAKPDLQGLQIGLTMNGAAMVVGNSLQLERMIENLVINAAQAIDESGKVEIVLNSAENHGSHVVRIRDNGPGVPADLRARIFDAFVTGKTEGIGLGLSICSRIALAHGGRILLNENWAPGCEFVVELPVDESRESSGMLQGMEA